MVLDEICLELATLAEVPAVVFHAAVHHMTTLFVQMRLAASHRVHGRSLGGTLQALAPIVRQVAACQGSACHLEGKPPSWADPAGQSHGGDSDLAPFRDARCLVGSGEISGKAAMEALKEEGTSVLEVLLIRSWPWYS